MLIFSTLQPFSYCSVTARTMDEVEQLLECVVKKEEEEVLEDNYEEEMVDPLYIQQTGPCAEKEDNDLPPLDFQFVPVKEEYEEELPLLQIIEDELLNQGGGSIPSSAFSVANLKKRLWQKLSDAAGALDNNQLAVRPNDIFKDFPFSHVVARKDKKDVNAQEVKEETEEDKWCMGHDCKSIRVIESTVDKVVESRWQSTVQVDNDNQLNEEREMKEQEMMVETLERALKADIAVEESDAKEEDSAPLSERVSKTFGKKLRRCLRCPAVFCTFRELRLHVKNLHKKGHSNRCEVCFATFAFKSYLMRHMTRHTGERPFKCELCEMSFSQSSALTRHKLIHTGERPFHCDVCERSFGVRAELTRHKLIHTDKRPFQCEVCERSFSVRSSLTRHKLIHTGGWPFKCGVCEMYFSDSSAFTNHNRIHNGERPFHCDVCKRAFVRKSDLPTHMRTHTGERPFQCNICKRPFSEKSNLSTHMRTHTGERPFHCVVCKRSFIVKYTLVKHMRTHTGERPFQCNVCKSSFTDKSNLRRHMRTHPSCSRE